MSNREAINALRLTKEELQLLLSRLDREAKGSENDLHRRTRRWPLQLQQTVLTLCCSATETKHLIVVPRNISVEGLSILHGGFLHPGSHCHVTLRLVSGKPKTISARVTRCRHLEKHVHEIGLIFMKPVDPREFRIVTDGQQLFNADHVAPEELAGRVMIVAEPEIQAGIKEGFIGTELELVFARDAKSAFSMLQEDVQLVYVQDTLPDMSGVEFLEQLSAHSRARSIMLLPEANAPSRDKARKAGAEEVLVWPCDSDILLRSAAEYLLLADLIESFLHSRLEDLTDEAQRNAWTKELKKLAEELASCMIRDDSVSALELTQQLHGIATSLNDPVLIKRLTEVLQADTQHGRIALDELGLVVRTCRKIAGSSPNDTATQEAA